MNTHDLCTTANDCASLLVDWCVVSVQCTRLDTLNNSATSSCIAWPRCRVSPYFGCSAALQECVHLRVESTPGVRLSSDSTTHTAGPLPGANPWTLVTLLFVAIAILAFAGVLFWNGPRKQKKIPKLPSRDYLAAAPPVLFSQLPLQQDDTALPAQEQYDKLDPLMF